MIYVPYSQVAFPLGSMTVVARASAGPPRSLAAPITEVIRALDKDQPVSRVATLTDVLDGSLSEPRFSMMLIALFAVAALALATIGVYGTMAYTATVRVPEIGIRMALGARRGDVLVLLLRQGLTLAVVGIALGVAGSALLTSLLETRLYDLSPRDPATFAATAALLVLVALAAVYIPAHRATRVDPVTALRWE
jgi:ABC-type antimicrobial peptide transport system permease subunit